MRTRFLLASIGVVILAAAYFRVHAEEPTAPAKPSDDYAGVLMEGVPHVLQKTRPWSKSLFWFASALATVGSCARGDSTSLAFASDALAFAFAFAFAFEQSGE